MKHILAVLGLAAALAGCGGTVRSTVEVRGFAAVSTGSGIDVEITTSPGWTVELIADRQAVGSIIVEVRGTTLWIGLREGTLARARWLAGQARVGIALPVLDRLEVADGSRARLAVEQADHDLGVELSTGSTLSGSVRCAALVIAASGGSIAEIGGTADAVSLVATDRSKLKLTGLETPSLDASLAGGSTAAVAVSQRLTVVAGGGSGLSFRGDARVESQALSGGSWLRKE
jgi:hypothetical protein